MEGGVGEFSFFQDIQVKNDIIIATSISLRPMATKFYQKVNLHDFTQLRPIKQVLVAPLHQDHVTN